SEGARGAGTRTEVPRPSARRRCAPGPPLAPTAWLLLTVQLVTDMTPENELSMPPPVAKAIGELLPPEPARAALPVSVQFVRDATPGRPLPRLMPRLVTPPPSATPPEPAVLFPPTARLPVKVQLVAESVPSRFIRPPPWP